eukprot:snap_masked-scaffold_15-processed-gene-5.29-mRNA-1 protein AED:1.00 eAED:1.00 QI:0/-1/0/0/-1/1/1/0/552
MKVEQKDNLGSSTMNSYDNSDTSSIPSSASKMPQSVNKKCSTVISSYFSDLQSLDALANVPEKVREGLEEFLNYENSLSCQVDITLSEIKKSTLKTKIIYFVSLKLLPSGNNRRIEVFESLRTLADFKLLQKTLSADYPYMIIPPILANTKLLTKKTKKEIESEAKFLKLFLTDLARNVFIRRDSTFLAFIGNRDAFTKQLCEAVKREEVSVGHQRWKEKIKLSRTPEESFDVLKGRLNEVNELIANYSNVLSPGLLAESRNLSGFAVQSKEFSKVIGELRHAETKNFTDGRKAVQEVSHWGDINDRRVLLLAKEGVLLARIANVDVKYQLLHLENVKSKLLVVKKILLSYARVQKSLCHMNSGSGTNKENLPRDVFENLSVVDTVGRSMKSLQTKKKDLQKKARQAVCATLISEIERILNYQTVFIDVVMGKVHELKKNQARRILNITEDGEEKNSVQDKVSLHEESDDDSNEGDEESGWVRYICTEEFLGNGEDELSVRKDEVLLFDKDEDKEENVPQGWIWLTRQEGEEEGYVPLKSVQILEIEGNEQV